MRSNSFNLVPACDIPGAPGPDCPVRRAELGVNRERGALLRLRGAMRLFTTSNTDFDDGTMQAVKDSQQLYVDVSKKLAPDDFVRDLRKLRLCSACTCCEVRNRCVQCWSADPQNVFQRHRDRLEMLLPLRGRVLDVGCGDGRYLGFMSEPAILGELRYLGIDPDVRRVQAMTKAYSWAVGYVGDLAQYRTAHPVAAFDHVLMLRSLNHVSDPRRDLQLAVQMLVPGGTLTVEEDMPFGLLRTRQHAQQAELSHMQLEHHNNLSSDQVIALLPPRLRQLHRFEAGPSDSTAWLLQFEKLSDPGAMGTSRESGLRERQ